MYAQSPTKFGFQVRAIDIPDDPESDAQLVERTAKADHSPIFLFGGSAVTVETLTERRALSTDGGIAYFDSVTSESRCESGCEIDDVFTKKVMMEELSDSQCKELFEHIAWGGRVQFSSKEKDVAKRSIIERQTRRLFYEFFKNEDCSLKKARRYSKGSVLLAVANCPESLSDVDARISQVGRAMGINMIYGTRDPQFARAFLDEKSNESRLLTQFVPIDASRL